MVNEGKNPCASCGSVHPMRTEAHVIEARSAILELLGKENPMTVRQTFYALLGMRTEVYDNRKHARTTIICKDERDYKGLVMRLLGEMREDGTLPWRYISDESRWMRKPESYPHLHGALNSLKETFKLDKWCEQDVRVEVWCEKNALSGILYPITAEFDVPFMVCAGFSSKTFLHEAATAAVETGKDTYIGYVGDHDPSGNKMVERMERDLNRYADGKVEFHIVKLAVTPEQIAEYDLPTRPTKTKGNAHAKDWQGGDSVEVDALPMAELRTIVNNFIVRMVNAKAARKDIWFETEQKQVAAIEAFKEIISDVGKGEYGPQFAITEM